MWWRFPIIGSGDGPGGFLFFGFGCKKSLNKRYVKVKVMKRKTSIAAEDMSAKNGLVCDKQL